MKEKLQQLISNAHFEEASQLIKRLDFHVFEELLVEIAFDNEDVSNYLFVVYLLEQQELASYHDLAYLLMAQPLCHLEQAYFTAYKHAKRAVELTDGTDVLLLENLLFLHGVPDQVMSDEEEANVAQKIVRLEPSHQVANEWLKNYKRKS